MTPMSCGVVKVENDENIAQSNDNRVRDYGMAKEVGEMPIEC